MKRQTWKEKLSHTDRRREIENIWRETHGHDISVQLSASIKQWEFLEKLFLL